MCPPMWRSSVLPASRSPPGYAYPMPRIPPSLFDQRVSEAFELTDDETKFLGTAAPVTSLKVRSLPAARNSQPYRNRRACAGNTSCIPICPIQAKYDPTITLNEATNNGAQLMDRAVASEILVENNRISGINLSSTRKRRIEDGKCLHQSQDIHDRREWHRDAAALADVTRMGAGLPTASPTAAIWSGAI